MGQFPRFGVPELITINRLQTGQGVDQFLVMNTSLPPSSRLDTPNPDMDTQAYCDMADKTLVNLDKIP
jgi:hypothetical protein